MKIAVIIFFVLLAVSACKNQDTILLYGKIVNPVDKDALLYDRYLMTTDTILINPDGTFSKSILVSDEHLGLFKHGNFYIPINLKPRSKIKIDFDTEDIKDHDFTKVIFSGNGSETSAFLVYITKLTKGAIHDSCYDLKPDAFQNITENEFKIIEAKIDDFQDKNPKETLLIEKMKFMILAAKTDCFYRYTRYNAEDNDSAEWIDSFREIVDKLPRNNAAYSKEISEYRTFLISYYETKIKNKLSEEQLERFTEQYMNRNIDEIVSLNTEQSIKDAIGNRILIPYYMYKESIRRIVEDRYKEFVKNPQYLAEFENTVSIFKKLKIGSVPPDFSLTDINGTTISLSALKGNVVYLDFWHTRCGPCISEVPFKKILEEKLTGIPVIFLSISIDDTRSDWEKFVKEKKLGGIQIYAPYGRNSEIARVYAIKGTPTYLIIDKEGRISEFDSSRPSNPETEKKLLQLATM
jgi:thiol-disulfide isomerase/thioredoxin